ncbi:MAG: heavy metal translocating P-type ATPase [Paracoccaceae bacterium]|nr:heavy metal translocating P-type ATPase [Paracoccaceae bacterium]
MTAPAPSLFLRASGDGLHSLNCTIEGITCGRCAITIESELNRLAGVASARVNATTRRLQVEIDRTVTAPEQVLAAVSDLGYGIHPFADDTSSRNSGEGNLLVPLAVAGFGTMNVMLFSVAVWAGLASDMGPDTRTLLHWASAVVAIPVVAYSASVFYLPAAKALRHGRVTMDAPISLAILATLAASLYETAQGAEHAYFDAAVSLTFFLLVGRVLDRMLRKRSSGAAENLRAMIQGRAFRIRAGSQPEEVLATELAPGDVIHVPVGELIPADAVLTARSAAIDDSAVTGESMPRTLRKGDPLMAGCRNVGPAFSAQVTAVGGETRLSSIADIAEAAETHRGRHQLLADRFSQGYAPLVIGSAMLGFAVWLLVVGASLSQATMIAVAVLVVTCPCAAGLATPAVAARAANLLLAGGVIVRDGGALERLAEVTDVVLDKTGTLTRPEFVLDPDVDAKLARRASTLAATSRHPLCRALSAAYPAQPLDGVREFPGLGLEANGGERLGSAVFTGAGSAASPDGLAELWFRVSGGQPARFRFSQSLRPGLRNMVEGLRRRGLRPVILSGDTPNAVAAVACTAGLATWQGGCSPEDKVARLGTMTGEGRRVAMFGDGLNDAAALAGAHVSIAPASATGAAQVAADVILLGKNLESLLDVIDIARTSRRLIAENLVFAAAYNVVSLPLALAGMLTPLVAAILMSSSSILVMLNALRLGHLREIRKASG